MGVKNLRPLITYIIKNSEDKNIELANVLTDGKNAGILAIDLNSIIHTVFRTFLEGLPDDYSECADSGGIVWKYNKTISEFKDDFNLRYITLITEMVRKLYETHKSEVLILCFDGSPPLAKIMQQRIRRFDSIRIYDNQDKLIFSGSLFSPNTEYTNKISSEIKKMCDLAPEGTYFSNFNVPGEGEHKIVQLLASTLIKRRGKVIVIGNDNDFFFLLGDLSSLKENDIYYAQINTNKSDGKINFTYYNMSRFVNAFISVLKLSHAPAKHTIPRYFRDFTCILMFLGNDFLPQMPFLHRNTSSDNRIVEMVQIMAHSYRKHIDVSTSSGINYITTEEGIHYANFSTFLDILKDREIELIKLELSMGDKTNFVYGDYVQKLRLESANIELVGESKLEQLSIQIAIKYCYVLNWNVKYYMRQYDKTLRDDTYYEYPLAPVTSKHLALAAMVLSQHPTIINSGIYEPNIFVQHCMTVPYIDLELFPAVDMFYKTNHLYVGHTYVLRPNINERTQTKYLPRFNIPKYISMVMDIQKTLVDVNYSIGKPTLIKKNVELGEPEEPKKIIFAKTL